MKSLLSKAKIGISKLLEDITLRKAISKYGRYITLAILIVYLEKYLPLEEFDYLLNIKSLDTAKVKLNELAAFTKLPFDLLSYEEPITCLYLFQKNHPLNNNIIQNYPPEEVLVWGFDKVISSRYEAEYLYKSGKFTAFDLKNNYSFEEILFAGYEIDELLLLNYDIEKFKKIQNAYEKLIQICENSGGATRRKKRYL